MRDSLFQERASESRSGSASAENLATVLSVYQGREMLQESGRRSEWPIFRGRDAGPCFGRLSLAERQ
jgi:hypothetical protein